MASSGIHALSDPAGTTPGGIRTISANCISVSVLHTTTKEPPMSDADATASKLTGDDATLALTPLLLPVLLAMRVCVRKSVHERASHVSSALRAVLVNDGWVLSVPSK